MQIENLVRAGAFDSLDSNRARLFAGAETILRRAQATAEEKSSGQTGLFGGGEPEKLRLPPLPDWEQMDRLGFEADAIGFHLTAHPLDAYAQVLKRLGVVASNKLEERAQLGAARVKLAGSVINSKERITRTGSRMAWVRLSDGGGSYEVTFFSETLARGRDILVAGNSVLITADIKLEGDSLRITAQEVEPLDQAAIRAGAGIRVWLQQTEAVGHIRALLEREGKGRGRVVLIPRLDATQDVEITLPGGFNVSPRLAQALKVLPGVERVEDV
jgi:DNA polymerase-3 subunit alpha